MHNAGTFFLKLILNLFSLLFIFPAILFSILVLFLTDNLKSGMVMLISALILHSIVKLSSINHSFSREDHYYSIDHLERESFGKWPNTKETPPPLDEIYRDIDCWNGETEALFRIIRERDQGIELEQCSTQCRNCKQDERKR
ncbi:hypothetical protein [Bacillus sp. FJAT-28004]|uniref:hypothetical protein n=1 Tax=Bacillus sp. FJAT-28004 TaxID=1679165 RepID=UPI0006B4EA4E|nr:hypothetical protein [Bacillus sp. FJAT-28004]